jgi:tetratricopeptide (TPR) repeat protein
MKRNLSLWSGLTASVCLLGFSFAPARAQQPAAPPTANGAATGKIHGRIINPTGQPQGGGTMNLSTDGGTTLKYSFPVSDTGDFTGEAPAGTYMMIYRAPDTPAGKMVDSIRGVKIEAGQDTAQDDDMSRQEYIDKMSPDEKKQLEDLKKTNADAMKANVLINQLNADLRTVGQDKHDIDNAGAAAAQSLGASASKADVDNKANDIRTAKYTDIESLMTKDSSLKPDEALLWTNLGYGQTGLKKFDDAITSYKKAIDLENASKKPRGGVLGLANAGLGEVYARTGKVQDANAAYDAAAKADPTNALLHLRNEAVIFFQQNNGSAQVAAADEAIKSDPNQSDPNLAVLYYIKGQGLVQSATVDPKTQRIVLPPDCTAAYQKYLELAPTGPYSQEVTGILQQAGEKVNSSYKAPKSK